MEAKQKVFFQINELLCFCLDSSPLPHPISLSLSLTFLLTLSSGAWAMVIYCLILAMNLSFLYETLTSLDSTWPFLSTPFNSPCSGYLLFCFLKETLPEHCISTALRFHSSSRFALCSETGAQKEKYYKSREKCQQGGSKLT